MAKQTTQAAATTTVNFRLVVRGNRKSDGIRVRIVRNVPAGDLGTAFEKGSEMAESICAELGNPFFNIYPPVGEKCNGTPSKGYEIVDGMVQKVAAPAPAAATA